MKENFINILNEKSGKNNPNNPSLQIFNKLPFPTKKTEEWIYTNPEMIFGNIKDVYSKNDDSITVPLESPFQISFINGRLSLKNTILPSDVNIAVYHKEKKLSNEADLFFSTPKDESIYELQSALPKNNYIIKVSKDARINTPIAIVKHYDTDSIEKIIPTQIMIEAEKCSKAAFVEIISSSKKESQEYRGNLCSDLTKIFMNEKSNIEYSKIIKCSFNERYLGTVHAYLKKDSIFNGLIITLGASISRHQLYADIIEENATASFHGLFSLNKNQHCDNLSLIRHLAPYTYSSQLYKGILRDESRGIFTGKLLITQNSKGADANQLSKNILLSPKAHVDTRPQLEVYADDVKATHGATVGQIGDDETFYLRSRGINAHRAFNMLCDGFSAEAIEQINNIELKNYLIKSIKEKSFQDGEIL